jgi:hypothetical protein
MFAMLHLKCDARNLLRHGEKSSRTRRLNRPESSLPRYLDPLGTAIVPSMSARRSALSVERYGVEDLSVER